MLTDWNFWFSVITAIVAIIALVQGHQQIKLSNKQYLFGSRVEYYLIAKGLIQLYENNVSLSIFQDNMPIKSLMAMEFIFARMTNNTYLEKITEVIAHPLENPYKKDFLIKLESMKDVSVKIKFIFDGKISSFLGNYVLYYQELLFKMYQYQITLNERKNVIQNPNQIPDKEKEWDVEKEQRDELQKAIKNLKEAYKYLKEEDIEKKIEKQIKLY